MSENASEAEAVAFMPDLYELDDAGEARLKAGRCVQCGTHSFPRREICQVCGPGPEVGPVSLAGDGVIYASTVVRVPSPVGLKPPYAYGYVNLDAAALRVFALFSGDPAAFRPGVAVKMGVEPLVRDPSGRQLMAYRFSLVAQENGQ